MCPIKPRIKPRATEPIAEVHVGQHPSNSLYDELGFVKDYLCPNCRTGVQLDHVDDVGTQWFKCSKCGNQFTKSKLKEREKVEEELKKPLEHEIEYNDGNELFVAEASDGWLEHQSGFFVNSGEKWIITELTSVRGTLTKLNKEGDVSKEETAIKPLLLYNNTGDRGFIWPHKTKVLPLNGKTIALESKTTPIGTIKTLMSYEAVQRFLKGETVNINDIYNKLKARQRLSVNLDWDDRFYDLIACTSIATHFFDVFGAFPIVFFYGSADTGKGRGVKAILYASHRGFLIVSPTEATTFRIIDGYRPTLGIDEFTKLEEDIMRIVRAIYKKGLLVPRVEKTKGEQHYLSFFETYCSLILASTRYLEPTTMTRTILITMKRAKENWLNLEASKKEPKEEDFADIRDGLYIYRLTEAKTIYETMNQLDKMDLGIYERELEIWKPILTIAKIVDEKVFQNLLALAREIYQEKSKGMYEEEKEMLLAIGCLFNDKNNPIEITFLAKDISEKLWMLNQGEYIHSQTGSAKIDAATLIDARKEFDKEYKPKNIGWKLRAFGFRRRTVPQGRTYVISISEYFDLCQRYGLETEKYAIQPSVKSGA